MQRRQRSTRRRRTQQGDLVEKRADRVLDLVQMGEQSTVRHALEGDPVTPGNRQTLNALQDPERRPPVPREALSASTTNHVPQAGFRTGQILGQARRVAAGGPSGMTADHIKVVLESERDCTSLWCMCQEFARGHIPAEILQAVRIGRMTALQKSQGGVCGIVVTISCVGWWRAPS